MAQNKQAKRKAKRKVKQQQYKSTQAAVAVRNKFEWLMDDAAWFCERRQFKEALPHLEKALKLFPNNVDALHRLGFLGSVLHEEKLELRALTGLYQQNHLVDLDEYLGYIHLLYKGMHHQKTIEVVDATLKKIGPAKIPRKKTIIKELTAIKSYCECECQIQQFKRAVPKIHEILASQPQAQPQPQSEQPLPCPTQVSPEPAVKQASSGRTEPTLKKTKVTFHIDRESFEKVFAGAHDCHSQEAYDLTLSAYQIRFRDSFENLISLAGLRDVRSFWYQEETAKKVLKTFRGRALLADEVGLGKTIEALMVFKEYVHRGMVKNALILTPTPLVSQWRDELKAKFDLDIHCTDDPDYASRGEAFWEEPFLLASINIAKSKKNFEKVVSREYDLVIVDEAHHLKNKNTRNWELINTLKKRFLLLLTATPVQNNLMELYNLITLLKPGQLSTAAAFKATFMTKGDPTDPQNREQLKTLLSQVMIRNTRAVAKLAIPPRTAQTVRVSPTAGELDLYQRITALAQAINKKHGGRGKLLVKNLLAEAGSSPQAVSKTLTKILAERQDLDELEESFRAVNTLCKSMADTSKNEIALQLIKKSSEKIIIFMKYTATMEHLSDFLEWNDIPHAKFHGAMTNQQKDEQIDAFRNDISVLLSTEAGGEGRNLQFCRRMINYDLPWNPMKIEQRIGRLHRIGQTGKVVIYNLCNADSIEDSILDILDRKINMFELVIGEIDMILGRVGAEKDFADTVFDIWMDAESDADRQQNFDKLAANLKRQKSSYLKTKVLDEKLFGENYEL